MRFTRARRFTAILGLAVASVAALAIPTLGADRAQAAPTPQGPETGYWQFSLDGGVFSFGDATFYGSMGGSKLNAPVVGLAPTPSGKGYWLVGLDGGVFSFGDAKYHGSTGGLKLNAPVVGIIPTPTGRGYWMVATDGGVFSFGDATFVGSLGSTPPAAPIVGFAPVPAGGGYWMLGSDGEVYPFGAAQDFGDARGATAAPVVSFAPTATGKGYWIAATDGLIANFGDAKTLAPTRAPSGAGLHPVVGLVRSRTGGGFWITRSDGSVTPYGDAPFLGDLVGRGLNGAVLGLATSSAASTGGAALSLLYGNAFPGFESSPVTMVARVKAPATPVFNASTGTVSAAAVVSSPNPAQQTVHLRVVRIVGARAEVMLAQRPNGVTAWMDLRDVDLVRDPFRIVVDRRAHTVKVYDAGVEVFSTTAGVGKADTPTPVGRFFVSETWKLANPGGAYGPYALGLSAFSEVLLQFGGGPGQVAIHGTNAPGVLGTDVSHGCIRISNAAVTRLIEMDLPLGTPVDIV